MVSIQTTKHHRIAKLELTVQRLHHGLKIFEGPRAIKKDVELVDENETLVGDETESNRDILPHLKEIHGYLRREQPRERPRELLGKNRCEQDKEEWYECQERYNGREYDEDPYPERCGYPDESSRFNLKLDIHDFEGIMQPNDFLDWLNIVERVFEYYEPLKHKKVNLVAIKLHKNAFFW